MGENVMEMTSRQRWMALLNNEPADRVPTDYWAVPELHNRLKRELNCADDDALAERLHIDRPRSLGPRCLYKHHPDDPDANIWGVRSQTIQYETGEYNEPLYHPLADATSVSDVEAFTWPTADWFDYTPITDALRDDDGTRVITAGKYEPFLLYAMLRGLEQAFEDLILEPDIADAILTHLFEYHFELNRRIYEAGEGRIDVFVLAEDLGGQTGPLFSIDHYKRFLLPNQKRMADLARSHGAKIFYHTDGSSRPFLPYLVDEVGIDILNPIQWRCPGMEREGLVRDYGDRVIFHGAMDNQQTLPFGTVDDVIAELKDNLRIFADARWICAPCHNIQAVTPTENVIAMYEAAHEFGVSAQGV